MQSASCQWRQMTWTDTGSPSLSTPAGIAIPGTPTRLPARGQSVGRWVRPEELERCAGGVRLEED
eukprot:2050235-Rhodomonas_salina.2